MTRGPWFWLLLAGILEIVWAVGVKYTKSWTAVGPSLLVVVAYAACLYPLSLAMKGIPAGTAYSVWVGMGSIGVALWGMLFFGESASPMRILSILLVLAGVVGLKLAR